MTVDEVISQLKQWSKAGHGGEEVTVGKCEDTVSNINRRVQQHLDFKENGRVMIWTRSKI